ncbi:phenylalanine--tRNA ligase subunit beta [Timonella sp. A28]|uniref:phenylalanine--tRNA ligase subunit beta n=1 Tax=Timonella sp. A28 TaxID=3442640 RepID=UPI003EBB6BF7
MPLISLPWLAEHVEIPHDLTAEQLASDLVKVGLEEEEIHSSGITGPLVVGRVLSLEKEPQKNGKTINWCQVDVGQYNVLDSNGNPTIARGIICGAHNFVENDLVVVALPGAVLPGPFAISSRKTYGHISDGMICSQRELGLGDDHAGIIVLTALGFTADELTVGQDALALLGLDEETLEINVTPDRGYCFSMRGVAREYSHSTGAVFVDPGIRADLPAATENGFPVIVDDEQPIHGLVGCDRFVTRIVRGVAAAGPSPRWMQKRLEQAGMRPISLAVDVTNYVMLDLGQPLHAYDLATVTAPIVVRRARTGEKLTTLDEAERTLHSEDLLITDSPDGEQGSRVVGLAGVMGGASTEVSSTTTDVLIEAAHFEQVSIARTARRHKLSSEAAKRFERGVDYTLPAVAAQRVVELLVEYGGGTADSAVFDLNETTAPSAIKFSLRDPQRLCGVDYSDEQVIGALQAVGCVVKPIENSSIVDVTPPSWRPDLTGAAELVEEVARLIGYDKIPSILPVVPAGRGLTAAQHIRRSVSRGLAENGFVEVLTYPFVSASQFDDLHIPQDDDRRRATKIQNPLQGDKALLRTHVLVTLLEAARRNVARGNTNIALFEQGLVVRPALNAPAAPQLPPAVKPTEEQLAALHAAVPAQPRHIAGVLSGLRAEAGWWGAGRVADWTDAVHAVEVIAQRAGVDVARVSDTEYAPYHPGRCARFTTADGTVIGHAGELHPKVLETLGLPTRTVAFEVNMDVLVAARGTEPYQAVPVSTFPLAKEDLAFVVDDEVTAHAVRDAIVAGAGDALEDLDVFDVFVGEQIGEGKKSLAFSLRLRAQDRTLSAEDTTRIRESVVAEVARRVGGSLRS